MACWRKRAGGRGYLELMIVFIGLILAFAGMPLIAHMFPRHKVRLDGGAKSIKPEDDDALANSLPWGSIKRVSALIDKICAGPLL